MYIVTMAARMRSSVFTSDARKARAAPWKLVRTLGGMRISFSAFSMASTASPSEAFGARLNEIVVEGNCPRWLIEREPGRSLTFATAESGTCDVPLPDAIGAAEPVEIAPLPAEPVVDAVAASAAVA